MKRAARKVLGQIWSDVARRQNASASFLDFPRNAARRILEPRTTASESIVSLGYKAATAKDIDKAIDLCASWKPDILLLSDEIDDFEDLIRSGKIPSMTPKIKIIIVTQDENKKLKGMALDIRQYVTGFLQKPFDLNGLGKALSESLEKEIK